MTDDLIAMCLFLCVVAVTCGAVYWRDRKEQEQSEREEFKRRYGSD